MDNRNLSEQVKEVLKSNRKGMTVSEVARAIGMNSQSMGRHLDVLAAAGHALHSNPDDATYALMSL